MARNTVRFAVCAGVLALGTLLAAAPRVTFGAGVLRRDGVIVPFAVFDGKRWISRWPRPAVEAVVPITTRDVPAAWWGATGALDSWQAWTAAGATALHVVRPDWVDVHCERQIGLRANYVAPVPAPPPIEQPYPKDGLAVSPPQPVERIAVVPIASDEARALIPALQEALNKAERQIESDYGHPVARRAREGRAPEIDAVYAVGEHPRVYYVEATRQYRLLGQAPDSCAGMAFGTGWFSRDGQDVRSLETAVDLLQCDRRGANYMLPLGAMRIADRMYWLAQFAGFDHERYVVVEIKPKTVEAVLSVWGGSCSR